MSVGELPMGEAGILSVLRKALVSGSDQCIGCQVPVWSWLDLPALELPALGPLLQLGDQVPLCVLCAPGLMEHWAGFLYGEGGTDEWAAADGSSVGGADLVVPAPLGAYARRRLAG